LINAFAVKGKKQGPQLTAVGFLFLSGVRKRHGSGCNECPQETRGRLVADLEGEITGAQICSRIKNDHCWNRQLATCSVTFAPEQQPSGVQVVERVGLIAFSLLFLTFS